MNIASKIKKIVTLATAGTVLALGGAVVADTVVAPEPASAASYNTWYKNGKGSRNILVKISPSSSYINTIKPGATLVLYGSNKVGWVPTNCELQRYTAGSWHHYADAYGRNGYWVGLPSYLATITLGTYCYS